MNTQTVLAANKVEDSDFTFFDALTFEFDEPPAPVREEAFKLFPSPPLPAIGTEVERTTVLHKVAQKDAGPPPPPKPKVTVTEKMSTPKAQTQCLQLCHKTTALIDRLSIRILEYLTSAKNPPYGFDTLAHDFVDTCQILFCIEGGLTEYNRTGQRFPPELLTELGHKFRVTQADFQILSQMMAKLLAPSNPVKRGWGKMFGDTDIKKITMALSKTRESLRMSSLVFQWSLGSEKVESEIGIGYTGLAAALNRLDHKAGHGSGMEKSHDSLNSQPPSYAPSGIDNHNGPPQQHQQQHQQQPQRHQTVHQPSHMQWSPRTSSTQPPESPVLGKVPDIDFGLHLGTIGRHPMSPDFRQNSSNSTDRHDRASTFGDSSSSADTDSLLENIKVIRHEVSPTTMPRCYARSTSESEAANMKATFTSAIRSKNHKLVEQLLHRGVSPNAGPDMHPLKEAIFAHDEESVRLLLLFGADPNDPDRDGITPLFATVERSFLACATILLKYGADPNLVAGPELESPLAAAVMGNMVGFSHLFLTYNGDANHVTTGGSPLLTSGIKKKTPKKFIDLLLEYGSNPNAKTRDGKTALFEALQVGRADIVTSLLNHGADPNLPGPKHMLWPATHFPTCLQVLLSHGADFKKTPGIMELAVSLNNIESVKILLKAGVNPDIKKDGTYTPLCSAIRDDRADLVQLLLSNKADPNTKASEYPAFKCVTHDRVHFLPILVAAGANLHVPKGILETAVSFKNMEALNWLLDQGLNPNDKTSKGLSPLTSAIRDNNIEMVDLLLLRGADPHIRGQDWPLCMAVRNPPILKRILSAVSDPHAFKGIIEMAVSANQLESIKLLLAAGVSVEDKNSGVFSPLTTAIREDRRDIVSYLLHEGGANVNSPGEHLPVVKALRRYHGEDTEILEMVLDQGADPNKIYRGWNGYMQAVENGDLDVLKLLSRKAGVDLVAKDELGRTVVEIAASRGWDEAVQVLQDGDIRLMK